MVARMAVARTRTTMATRTRRNTERSGQEGASGEHAKMGKLRVRFVLKPFTPQAS